MAMPSTKNPPHRACETRPQSAPRRWRTAWLAGFAWLLVIAGAPGMVVAQDEPAGDGGPAGAAEDQSAPDANANGEGDADLEDEADANANGAQEDATHQPAPTDSTPAGPGALVARIDFRFTEAGAPIEGPVVESLLEAFAAEFARVHPGLDFDRHESWRAYNRPRAQLREGLGRNVRFAVVGSITIDVLPVGRLSLAQGTYRLRLFDVASEVTLHEFETVAEEVLTASGRVHESAIQRVIEAVARAIAPQSARRIDEFFAVARDPWRDDREPEPVEPALPVDPTEPPISPVDVEEVFAQGYDSGFDTGFRSGYDDGFSAARDAMPAPPAPREPLGFGFELYGGGDLFLGHSRTHVIPQIPDDRFKYITRAHGAPTLSAALTFEFDALFGTSDSNVFAGLDGTFGLGEYIRFWQAGLFATQRFVAGGIYLDLTLGAGAMQLNAGSDDISDVAFFQLVEFGVDEETARSEAFDHRMQSPVLMYFALRPRLGLAVTDSVDVFVQAHVLFAPASDRFTLAGRRWGGNGEPTIPGFEWSTIGFSMALGTTIRF